MEQEHPAAHSAPRKSREDKEIDTRPSAGSGSLFERRHNDEHYQFLALTLSGRASDACTLTGTRSWDWERLVALAADEAVLACLRSHLKGGQALHVLPAGIQDLFESYAELNAERNRDVLAEIESHALDLNEAGIEPVILKGPAYLLTGVYPNPADRLILDIDLLIPEPQASAAMVVFRELGFLPDDSDEFSSIRHHRPPLVHPDRFTVEIHHNLDHKHYPGLLPLAEVLSRSRSCRLGNANVRVLHPDDMMIQLVVHSQLHHAYVQRIWPPLRAQYDLLLLQQSFGNELDWALIRHRFQQEGYGALLDLHLLQIHEVLGLELPYKIRTNVGTTLRRYHRKLLWRAPGARYVDPLFVVRSIMDRGDVIQAKLTGSPGGLRTFISFNLRPSILRKLGLVLRK